MTLQRKKYLIVALVALLLGAFFYAGKQLLAARELDRLNAARIDGGWYAEPFSFEGKSYLVPPNEIHSSGIVEGDIPALTHPKTVSIDEADEVIADDLGGIAVEINGEHRFYPVQIMNWHEVVHDTLGGKSILVYYGPLTGAAAVYELPTDDMRFVVSGQEYNNDVFLKQEGTDTLWSGILGKPVVSTNEDAFFGSLALLPSAFMTWGEWKMERMVSSLYPTPGSVLSIDTGYVRDYTRHPYGNYENSPGVYFPVNHSTIPVRAKEPAYLVQLPEGDAVFINTVSLLDSTPSVQVGDACAVGLRVHAATYTQIFNCTLNGQMLTLSRKDANTFTDAETGSLWMADGLAFEGVLAGSQLEALPAVRLYTFAADALSPKATLMGSEFIFDEKKSANETTIDPSTGTSIEGENTSGATIEVLPNE